MRFIDIVLHEFKIDMPADDDGMGIPRKKMPQVRTKDYPEYFQYLKDNGVHFQKLDSVKAASLKPTQSEFSKQGVEKQLNKIYNDLDDSAKPLIASSDDYIIDGHHRWLAAKNTRRSLTVFKADIPMRELMSLTLKFPKVYFKDIYNEGYKIQLERDPNMYVLHITDTKTGKRTEVRGKSDYETTGYDANDKLHQLLDKIGKSANISELINGEVVTINPKHPDATKANAAADVAFNESTDLDSLRKFVKSQREAPDQVLYQMMMAPDTYGHSASNFVRSWYDKTKEENGLNDVDSALEIMVDELGLGNVNETAGVGRVVKGVNTTVDVGPNEIIKQVKKFGNDVDRDGFPKKHLR